MSLQTPHLASAPRDYTPGAGLPGDRMAHLAARRAFVSLKLTFIDVIASIEGSQGAWLRQQVRGAEEPVDLWLLRAPLFSALAGTEPARRQARQRVRRALDAVFPESQPTTAFSTL